MRYGLLLLGTMAACAPQPNGAPPATPAANVAEDSAVVGTVRVVGSMPVSTEVVVHSDGGRSTTIVGALAAEIRELSGAVVSVRGRPNARGLEATDYEIRSVDGRPVVMGTIEGIQDGVAHLRTRSGEIVHVNASGMPFRVGQRVWVQGQQTLRVQSYGVIRQ
jgi:hypothetical protein